MKRHSTRLLAATAICAASMAAAPGAAHAYDVHGIGLGADVALGGPSGLALTVGLGRMELDFIVGASFVLRDNEVLEPDFAGAVGFFYTLTDAEQTNLQIGGRVGLLVDAQSGPGIAGRELRTDAALTFEVDLRLEHRLDDHCVINLQVGVAAAIWPGDSANPDFSMGIGNTGLVGGAGFRYYFDSLGATARTPAPLEPAPAARRAEPAPAAAPAAEPAQGETPYWEQ